MKESRSKYYLCTPWKQPLEIDIYNYEDRFDGVYLTYWVRVFKEIEKRSSVGGLIFYVVWHHGLVRDLPSYGDNVVAILLMDENRAIPHYLSKVRFVFKTYGFRPWCNPSLRGQSAASLLKFLKECAVWVSHFAFFLLASGVSTVQKNKMVIPLGYARQTDVPLKTFETRHYLVGFLGSIEHNRHYPFSLRALLGTPKGAARSRMVESLQKLAATMPDSVFLGATGSFNESIKAGGGRYSEIMSETKICMAPRGSSVETYRFFEAMRQGCVVICDRLPPHWFYAGCPAIQIDDWRDAAAEVRALSADLQRLSKLHRASLVWWETKLSEPAVAELIVKSLEVN